MTNKINSFSIFFDNDERVIFSNVGFTASGGKKTESIVADMREKIESIVVETNKKLKKIKEKV